MQKVGKIVVSGISIILVVGVILAVVAVVHRSGDKDHDKLSPQKKAVTDFCSVSSFQDNCQKTLSSVNGTNPKDFVVKAITASKDEVAKFFNYSDSLISKFDNQSRTKLALEDCKEFMTEAQQALEQTLAHVGEAEIHNFGDRINDLRTWLGGVLGLQQACLDNIVHDNETQKLMNKGMVEADKITANALDIITRLHDILPKFGLQLNNIPSMQSRKLLSNEYPQWFGAEKRKLVAEVDNSGMVPNVVVAQDGSGQFKTIGDAVKAYPQGSKGPYVIYVKTGIYHERVVVEKTMTNVLIYGDGSRKTIITGKLNVAQGLPPKQTATFTALGAGFIAKNMGFQNTAGPTGEQALAFMSDADKTALLNCRVDGYQDSLYANVNRHFYRNCVISGTVDFIYGSASAVIQNSKIIVRRPGPDQKNAITAQGKVHANDPGGIVIHNCKIVAEQKLFADRFLIPTYLGRPWKPYSTTVFMENIMGDFIQPDGWMPWSGTIHQDTCYYAEYANRGPGADVARRVQWKGVHPVIDKPTAMRFTAQAMLNSQDNWLAMTKIPFIPGLLR